MTFWSNDEQEKIYSSIYIQIPIAIGRISVKKKLKKNLKNVKIVGVFSLMRRVPSATFAARSLGALEH